MKKKKIAFIAGALAVVAGAGLLTSMALKQGTGAKNRTYVGARISRGNIEKTVSSSGTLEAVSSVSVLAQMSGRVEKVLATYNDKVKKGQVLVELNTDMLKIQAQEQTAAVRKAQANYNLQLLDFQNKSKLASKNLVSDYDLKSSKSSLEVCAADLESAQAALDVIKTEINQYAFIASPLDGIVMACNVSVGQSVVEGSSSNSSSLFTLAPDLRHMQIKAAVDELDIASICQGQKVRFSVEARPGQTFDGTVKEIRLVPTTSDNVVNYSVIILADNKDGKLLPGMTAEVDFIEESKQNALLVPSSALRFHPTVLTDAEVKKKIFEASLADMPPELREKMKADFQASQKGSPTPGTGQGLLPGMMGGPGAGGPPPGGFGGPPGAPGTKKASSSAKGTKDGEAGFPGQPPVEKKNLWVQGADGEFSVLRVQVGVTNGTQTEILGDSSLEGKTVVVKEKVD